MPVPGRFKLEKLALHAYEKPQRRTAQRIATFHAMYNPATIMRRLANQYGRHAPIGVRATTQQFTAGAPTELTLTLILDNSLIDEVSPADVDIATRVDDFLQTAYVIDSSLHVPRYLSLEWGDLNLGSQTHFPCVLGNVDINYTVFDRNGNVTRAELVLTLIEDEDPAARARRTNLQSPDLTHRRIVRSDDTLPLLCHQIYGDSRYYLQIARVNGLDNFRSLTPGQALYFPPLANL